MYDTTTTALPDPTSKPNPTWITPGPAPAGPFASLLLGTGR